MRIAFIANTDGHLDTLEKLMLTLCARTDIDRIVGVGDAVNDLSMVYERRCLLFPKEVNWQQDEYRKFVLASVIHGISDVPPEESSRNERMGQMLQGMAIPPKGWQYGPCRILQEQKPEGEDPCLILTAGKNLPDGPRPFIKKLSSKQFVICPGRVIEGNRKPSTSAVVTLGDSLQIYYVDQNNQWTSAERYILPEIA